MSFELSLTEQPIKLFVETVLVAIPEETNAPEQSRGADVKRWLSPI